MRKSWLKRAPLAIAMVAGGALFCGQAVLMEAKAGLSQILLSKAWAQTLDGEQRVKPWRWADVWPVAQLALPRLGVETIVLSGTSGEALAFGPGHMDASPAPGGDGTTVFAAHRDTHFRFLKDVRLGDEVTLTDQHGQTFNYRVAATRIVRADASGIDPSSGNGRLALVTCYPFNSIVPGPDRFVVIAELVVDGIDI